MFNSKINTNKNLLISNQIFSQITKVKSTTGEIVISQPIIVMNKNLIIFNQYVGAVFLVYNGHLWSAITVKNQMVGRKFGEFIFTKKIAKFAKKGERRKV